MNISLFLQMAADACPDRPALTHDGNHYTYAQLYNAAKHAAQTFESAGCKYVSLLDVSSPAVPIALMGAAMAGIPYVPLNYRLSEEQIVPLFDRISPAYLISGERDDNYDFSGWAVKDSDGFLRDCLAAEPTDYFKDVVHLKPRCCAMSISFPTFWVPSSSWARWKKRPRLFPYLLIISPASRLL